MFRMIKHSVLFLDGVLIQSIQKRNTNYKLTIPVIVRLSCTFFKLSHGARLFMCNKMFAMDQSTVSIMLQDIVYAINVAL